MINLGIDRLYSKDYTERKNFQKGVMAHAKSKIISFRKSPRCWFSLFNLCISTRNWNNDNGTVEILAQSDKPAKLAKFIQEVRKGPSKWSNVTYVDVTMANFSNYNDFRIAN